jgi:MarR family transcriptional regulator, organic hydroperoxide resistance regulator
MANEDDGNLSGHRLLSMLRQTHDVILKLRQRELRKYDLTPEQAAALMVVHALGNKATTAEISRRLFRESNSMTVLLRRMETRGLISKRPDAHRKNVIRISLTKKGAEAYQNSLKIDNFNHVISKMKIEDRKNLWSLLETLRNNALQDMRIDINSYSDFSRRLTSPDEQSSK